MGLWLQLRMLLWKNFLLRKRQKFRLIVELLWPLFLFLILMWVRTKGLRENMSECHFTPKALPSVGQVPFVQSFLCSFNNTCHLTEKEAQIDGSNLQASRADSLLTELSSMYGQRLKGQDLETAESVVSDLTGFSRADSLLTELSSMYGQRLMGQDLETAESVVSDLTGFSRADSLLTELSSMYGQRLMGQDLETAKSVVSDLTGFSRADSLLTELSSMYGQRLMGQDLETTESVVSDLTGFSRADSLLTELSSMYGQRLMGQDLETAESVMSDLTGFSRADSLLTELSSMYGQRLMGQDLETAESVVSDLTGFSRADSLLTELSSMYGQRLMGQDLETAESVVSDLTGFSRADSLLTELSSMYGQRLMGQDLETAESVVSDLTGFSRADSLLTELSSMYGQRLMGQDLKTAESVVSDLNRLASLIQGVTSRQVQVKGVVSVPKLVNSTSWVKEEIFRQNISLDENAVDSLIAAELAPQNISLGHLLLLQQNSSLVLCNSPLMISVLNVQSAVVDQLCRLSTVELQALSNILRESLTAAGTYQQVVQYVENNLGQSFSWNDWNNMRNLSIQVWQEFTSLQNYTRAMSDLAMMRSQYSYLADELVSNNVSRIEQAIIMFNYFLCGNQSGDLIQQLLNAGGKSTQWDDLRERMRDSAVDEKQYVYDNTSTPACNSYYEMLDSSPPLRALWRMFKPFIRGKILYTPETVVTNRLMTKLNSAFDTYKDLYEFTYTLSNVTLPNLKDSLVNNTLRLRVIKAFLDSPASDSLFNNTFLHSFLGSNYNETITEFRKDLDIFLKPNNTQYRENTFDRLINVTTDLNQLIECFDWNKVVPYPNEDKALEAGMELVEENKLWALLVFIDPGNATLNPNTTYKIRMNVERVDNTEFIQDTLQRPGARIRPAVDLKYITYGFAYLQDMMDHIIIEEHSGRQDLPGVFLQQFPYPCYVEDRFVMAISRTFPLFMVLSWVYTCAMIVKSVVYEKEQRLKETMRVMGLDNGVHWLGWFIDSMVPMLVTIMMLTTVLVYGKVLKNADPTLVFAFLTTYGISVITQSFLISTFFSKANLSAACGGIIFFVLYLPYSFLVRWILQMGTLTKALLAVSSNVALGIGAGYFSLLEERGTGVSWGDLWQSPLYGDTFNLGYVMIMMAVDAVIYFVLTWYIEAVFPGDFGIPKRWYFPVTKTYWFGKKYIQDITDSKDRLIENEQFTDMMENFEAEPQGMKRGVTVHRLGMVYSNGKVAVNNLSINFYENQITSFLGHNGAGKTTTISILTGMFPPTSGTALIYGLDIRKHMDAIRNSLGMCPQHNVLFNLLTVEETLWFFALLRGKDKDEVRPEIQQMIADLGLPHKATSLAKDLSGGMQRKLSVAVAFIGGSKTVILDEPTSGVDPYSRRSIWDLLIKYKKDRTVILTTHYMDEADLLGDRIAIISDGQLQCCGSSVFLKSHFGSGYYLTIELQLEATGTSSESHIQDITEFIKESVPSARFLESVGEECTYLLPQGCNQQLPALFNNLDLSQGSLQIRSYGISDTSLEEIFLRVTEDNDQIQGFNSGNESLGCIQKLKKFLFESSKTKPLTMKTAVMPDNTAEKEIVIHRNGTSVKYLTVPMQDQEQEVEIEKSSSNKNWRQFVALHIKRFHHTRRNKKALFSELFIPAVFVCITMIVTSILPELRERPPLPLNPWIYPAPRFMFYSLDSLDLWARKYQDQIRGPYGIGAVCLPEDREDFCVSPTDDPRPGNISMFGPACSCASGAQVCPANSGKPDPPSFITASDDTMYDMTGSNISDWILKTQDRYNRARAGGFSLGVKSSVPNWNLTEMIQRLGQIANSTIPNQLVPGGISQSSPANLSSNNVMVWFFNKDWASSVSYMNALNNVVLRASLPADREGQFSINTINHPMNYTKNQLGIEMISTSGVSLLHAIAVLFALSFVPASFTLYLIEERVSNSKHLQMVSGVNRLVYWLEAFSWDMVCYLLAASLCVFVFLVFNEQSYVSSTNFPGLIALLVLYGWSCTSLMYPFSFYFDVPSSAFVALACCNMFVGIITTITTFVLSVFDDEDLKEVADVLQVVFLVSPHYCLGSGLLKLATSYIAREALAAFDISLSTNIFAWGFLGKPLLCMFVTGIIFFLITLGVEFKVLLVNCKPKHIQLPEPIDEEDVQAERLRIHSGDRTKDILVVKDLSKVYKQSASVKPAVNQICVGVQQGECFGLLGLNGAGKTSTFKMLTGATSITSGEAGVKGFDIVRDLDVVRSMLGYCPQFDALDPLLTPREHLEFYARLRNIPGHKLQHAVDWSLKHLGLGHYSDRLSCTLSGGNKRKLSTAIALLGDPPLVFLDEPTSGMDPKSRRFLWSCIQDIVRQGRSVILTSHSMEECEALCTRLTIMVNGEFKCLGNVQHLKTKYGGGYSLVVRCRPDSEEAVKQLIAAKLQSAVLMEAHHNQLRYQLDAQLDVVFSAMESAKEQGLMLDYSLSQTTLEEVFLRFASEQSDAVKSKRGIFRYVRRAVILKCNKCCSKANAEDTDPSV